MNYRSTNGSGKYMHVGGAIIAGAEFGSGIELNPNSSGADPNITAAGDESNKNLRLTGKGAGGVVFGATSTGAIQGLHTQASTYSHGAISANRKIEVTFASTTMDVTQGDMFVISSWEPATANFSSVVVVSDVRLSTVATSRVTVVFGNISSTATSTASGTLRVSWLDLTA